MMGGDGGLLRAKNGMCTEVLRTHMLRREDRLGWGEINSTE